MDTPNKIYLLNLQQQVRKNQLLIESLAQGLRITGAGETLPEQAAEMDAYLLSGEDGYSLYLRISGEWIDMGRFPAPGEQGPAGPKGSVGTIGSIVCNATAIDFGLAPSVRATVSGDNVTFDFELPRGETGIQGPQGPQGPRGLTGPRGLQGQQGDPGKAFRIIRNDSVVTPSDLPAASTAGEGVGYLVGTAEQGYTLYVTAYVDPADTDPSDLVWVDAGPFIPSEVIVDHELALESLNAIANDPVTRALGSKPLVYFRDKENITEDIRSFTKDGLPISEQPTGIGAYTTKYICFGGYLHFTRNTRTYISFFPENDDEMKPQLRFEWIHVTAGGVNATYIGGFWLANKEVLDEEIARSTRDDEIHQREIVLLKNLVYDTVAASYSYNIDYAFYASVPASVEVSGQYHSILDDAGAQVEKISGSSVVWNQAAPEVVSGNYQLATVNYGTISFSDGVFHMFMLATGSGYAYGLRTVNTIRKAVAGHKYLIAFDLMVTRTGDYGYDFDNAMNNERKFTMSTANKWERIISITTSVYGEEAKNFYVEPIVTLQSGDSIWFKNPKIIDLTEAFPTDTPTSTIDPRLIPLLMEAYQPQSDPVIKSSVVKAVKSRGFNLWDEQVELGYYNVANGNKGSSNNELRSKNPIEVFPNTTYYLKAPQAKNILFYDANDNFISYIGVAQDQTFTTPNNCAFIKFNLTTQYGTTYNNDICINRSNVALNGTYRPHVADQLVDLEALGLTEAQRTLRSAGTLRDDLSLVEQQDGTYNLVKNTLVDNYVFTGSEAWIAYSAGWRTVVLTGKEYKSIGSVEMPSNVISDTGLALATRDSIAESGGSTLSLTGDTILVGNKDGLTGKAVVYELATPTSETLLTGLEFGAIELIVERGGSFNVDADNAEYGAVPGLVMDLPILMYE